MPSLSRLRNLQRLLSSKGSKALATLNTPLSQLSNRTKALGALSGLGVGAAIGDELGQPIWEALKHSNPEGFLSKAELALMRAELEAGARASSLDRASRYLDEAIAKAHRFATDDAAITRQVQSVIDAQKQKAMGDLSSYLERQGGAVLFPRAAELSGILAQARASEVIQDAAKAIPIAGPGADISQLARNLTIVNSLANPEVVSGVKASYQPLLDNIFSKAQSVVDSSTSRIVDNTVPKLMEPLNSSITKAMGTSRDSLDAIRESLSRLKDPAALLGDIDSAVAPKMREAIESATSRINSEITLADRSLSPSVELLRNNSLGIPLPTDLKLDTATALSAAGDKAIDMLVAPAAEATGKVIAKALGKEVPGLGWAIGAIDSGGSIGRNAVFDKYVSGAFEGPGGNYLVDKYYYTPNANTVYSRLIQPGGAVDRLYSRSLDPSSIAATGKSLLPESLHKFLPKTTS